MSKYEIVDVPPGSYVHFQVLKCGTAFANEFYNGKQNTATCCGLLKKHIGEDPPKVKVRFPGYSKDETYLFSDIDVCTTNFVAIDIFIYMLSLSCLPSC